MHSASAIWRSGSQMLPDFSSLPGESQLVLYFGTRSALTGDQVFSALRKACPNAHIAGCSTGGEIFGSEVHEGSVVAVGLHFKNTPLRVGDVEIVPGGSSREAGAALGRQIAAPDLRAIFLLSDGIHINGSELIDGVRGAVGEAVQIAGGLAGDGAAFQETWVGLNRPASSGRIVAIGFCGTAIEINHGSDGGWDVFGPERIITKSVGNVLWELDGRPVLPLYKSYLGPEAANLPGSALLFPLSIGAHGETARVVRTVLGVNEAAGTMTFAGDMPEGWTAQLMRGNINRLIAGAEWAAEKAHADGGGKVAILVSCIGRRLLLGQRIEDEAESVAAILAPIPTIGFYSYGEIGPHKVTQRCELHNQTMTVVTIGERGEY